MKYNLSSIMKRAWEIKRKLEVAFAKALKMSWVIAKKEVELKKEWYEPDGTVEFNIWNKCGMVRAYYRCSWFSKYKNNKKDNFVSLV